MSKRWMPRFGTWIAATLLLAAPASGAGDPGEARAFVESTVNEVLGILQEQGLDSEQRRLRIEAVAYERFHFDVISKLVLARKWKKFSPEQLEAFTREFREMLSQSYGRRIDRYEQESVEILGERVEPRGDVTVRTRIVGGQADNFEVDYRLRHRDGAWGVIDVVVEGVSLVSSYRSQFAEVLGRGSPDELLRRMRDKNAALRIGEGGDESEEAAAAAAGGG